MRLGMGMLQPLARIWFDEGNSMPTVKSRLISDELQMQAEHEASGAINLYRLTAALISGAIVIATLYLGADVLLPLAIAFLIGFALNPLVSKITRWGLPRIVSVILVMTFVLALLSSLTFMLVSQARILGDDLPTYQTTVRSKMQSLQETIESPGIIRKALDLMASTGQQQGPRPADVASDGERPTLVEVMPVQQSPFKTAAEWLAPTIGPLATAGIVFVFVFLVLLDRRDLRDRLLRLLGGNIHRSTTAIEEAGARISKYLLMQLLVNVSYAIPMTMGLWFIGVPGAVLWGALAALMRFIPYIGPLISAVFPIGMAFAVDPGWNVVLMTVGLIVVLELISNNIIEPLLYGTSTGLSAISLITAATFWTLLWGPIGLILSTPLTVCLLVLGRNLPQFNFLDTLLGSAPALDTPTRIYQRLIAGDPDEASEIAITEIKHHSLGTFYNDIGIEVLRLASIDYDRNATAEHRLRIANGMDELLDNLRDEYAPTSPQLVPPSVVMLGGKWEIDTVSGEMLTHLLQTEGVSADHRLTTGNSIRDVDKLGLEGVKVVCIGYFHASPLLTARHLCRKIKNQYPDIEIILALWNSQRLPDRELLDKLGASAVVTSITEAAGRIHMAMDTDVAAEALNPTAPEADQQRVTILEQSQVLDGHAREELDSMAKRAVDVFNVGFAVISAIDLNHEFIIGQSKALPGVIVDEKSDMITMPRSEAICNHVVSTGKTLVVKDTERDPRFTDHPAVELWDIRFYAGAPLQTADGHVLGALCLLDTQPHELSEDETQLLSSMAADIVSIITGEDADDIVTTQAKSKQSATVGQVLPD
jgi:predicted PurR-regulated permease PerM